MPEPLRILHLEDDPVDLALIQETLKTAGVSCRMRHVQNRDQFETALSQDRFDVILSDYALPNYNGFAALEFARNKVPDIPFILLSGTLGEDVAVESLKTGATDYILKQRLDRLAPAVLRAARDAQEHAEKKRAEEAVRESQERYRSLVELSPDAIFIQCEGKFAFLNRMAARLFAAAEPLDLLGKPVSDFVHAESREIAKDLFSQSPEENALAGLREIRLVRRDGASLHVEITAAPLTFEGKPATHVAMRDISERKRAEDVMRQLSDKEAPRENAVAAKELVALLAFGLLVFVLGYLFNLFEPVFAWTLKHKETLVDEFLGTLIVLSPALALFGYRRWKETSDRRIPSEAFPQITREAAGKETFPKTPDVTKDLIALASLGVVVFTIGHQFKLFETFFEWVLKHKETVLDDFFGTLLVLAPAFALFGYRRWKETKRQFLAQRQTAEALRILHHELDRRVQQRTAELLKTNDALQSEVNERKHAEQAQRKSEAFTRSILESALDCMIVMDHQGRIVEFNAAAEKTFGYTPAEAIGQEMADLIIPPAMRERHRQGLARYIATGQGPALGKRLELSALRKGGAEFPVELTITRIIGSQPPMFTGFLRDIAERKRAEAALRQSEERFRELAENIQEVFWITTADMSEVIYASPAYEKIWGRSINDLYSRPQDWMDAILPEDRPQVIDAFTQLGQGLPEVSVEYRIRRPDGSVRWVSDRGFPIRNEAGQTYRTGGIAKDITESKHLQEHLQQAQKMEAIGQLAGGIAHDFNNMLGCIMGYTELAAMDPDATVAVKENLQDVIKASHRAKELVQQILTFSRQQEQQRSPIQLKPIIKEALKLLRASLPSTIQICADVDGETPSVLADPTQIHQIIMNLATNAGHAMSRRQGQLGIKLSLMDVDAHFARSHPDLRVGRYVTLAVSDTGCGMDQATLKRIFEPFFTTKPPGEGTGLGLSVVHGIMKTHEGAITVYSEPGKGTTFNLYFPALKASTTEIARKPTAIPKGSGQRILFVDDEAPLSNLGKKMLEQAGYSVTAHTSSPEALAAFRQSPAAYDLVITDFTMPTMTGDDLARELLKLRADVPIILATGFGGAMTPAKAGAIGIRELLLKPTTAQTLAEAAHRVLTAPKKR